MRKYIALTFIAISAFIFCEEYQIPGTHAFFTFESEQLLPSYDPIGFVSRNQSYELYGMRLLISLEATKHILDSGAGHTKTKSLHSDKVAYRDQGNLESIPVVLYQFPIGDLVESAIITCLVKNPSSIRNADEIAFTIFDRLTWKSGSKLAFDKATYYTLKGILDLAPYSVMRSEVQYGKNGIVDRNSDVILKIGTWQVGNALDGKESELLQRLVSSAAGNSHYDFSKIDQVAINGKKWYRMHIKYMKDGHDVEELYSICTISGRVFWIDLKIMNMNEKKYIDYYGQILNGFTITKF